jgi:hypothetical protein
VQPLFRDRSLGRSSPGVRFPFRAGPRLGCPCFLAARPLSRPRRPSARVRLSWGSCSLERNYDGCPLSPPPDLATGPRRVRVARPSPVPSSGFLPLSTDLAALAARANPFQDPPFAVAPRRFAALFHAARIPGVALQSFPFSRSRTRSRGPPASLRVRVRPPNGAARSEGFAAPFPGAPTSSPRRARGSPDWKAGTTVPWSR